MSNKSKQLESIKLQAVSSANILSMVNKKLANYLNTGKLASLVRSKRQERGLREISEEIGTIRPSRLSRVENSKVPDIDTFLALCDWLEVAPAELIENDRVKAITSGSLRNDSTPDKIALLLRSDPNIDPTMGNALALIIQAAYRDLCR